MSLWYSCTEGDLVIKMGMPANEISIEIDDNDKDNVWISLVEQGQT